MRIFNIVTVLCFSFGLWACTNRQSADAEIKEPELYQQVLISLKSSTDVRPPLPDVAPVHTVFNREAIIPPQCYTRTEGRHNPCYVCHQDAVPNRENVMNDGDLQAAYSFSDQGMTNHWQNLFEDRRAKIAKISDAEILTWIATDNYSDLPKRLEKAGFEGWIPDLENLQLGGEAFDQFGFAKDGSHWVAFNYKPLPSTFWPTNGSTDDVMIRLPASFRQLPSGQYSRDVYRANLAIVEANLKDLNSISTLPVDEKIVNKDLNMDGRLSVVSEISAVDDYVGQALGYYKVGSLYPQGTEFLHTVRYVGINEGKIGISTRMKEVRYMKKWKGYSKPSYARQYQLEGYEKDAGNLPGYSRLGDYGLDNGIGWSISGFIEGGDGRLRVSTHEENFFCMGCHNSIGSTIDKTFSFARKIEGRDGWGYINLEGMADAPNLGEQQGEYLSYFERVGGGDEFRSNTEMLQRWFDSEGRVDKAKVQAADVYSLITPSVERALQLNKAYKTIVDEQDFIFGRDATVIAPHNVYQSVDNATAPTLDKNFQYRWDIRLDWRQKTNSQQASR